MQLKDSRSAETGKSRPAPLSRDKDKLALLLQLEHHWGRIRLRFQSKVPGEGIGRARRGLSKASSKWTVGGHASRRRGFLGRVVRHGTSGNPARFSPSLTHVFVLRSGLPGNR